MPWPHEWKGKVMPGFRRLLVPCSSYDALVAQALAEQPLECCGLLAGVIEDGVGRVVRAYPLVNELASPIEYRWEGKSTLAALRELTANNHEVLAAYHSHPTSAAIPSRKDLQQNWETHEFVGDLVHLIVSLAESPPSVRAWWLGETDYREAEWVVI
jgi:proteasome lid subunit RPN8/RPN11